MFRRNALAQHPNRPFLIIVLLLLILAPLRIAAFSIAWANGFQLWFPEFMIYATASLIAVRIVGVQSTSYAAGLARGQHTVSPAIAGLTAALCPTIFAVCVIVGVRKNALVLVGLICILTNAFIRLDRQQLRQRISAALGNPRGRSGLYPPRKPES